MNNKIYPFYRLVLPNLIVTVFCYVVFLTWIKVRVEIFIWLMLGCWIPLMISPIFCAEYGLSRYRSSIRPLLKIVFYINIPLGVAISYTLFDERREPLIWLFASSFFLLYCAKDFLLTFAFLPTEFCRQFIQKRYVVLQVPMVFFTFVIVSLVMILIMPKPFYLPKRYHVADSLGLAAIVKMASTEFYSTYERFPYDNAEAGLSEPMNITSQSVRSIEIKPDGIIKITYNGKVKDNAILNLKATVEQGQISAWQCAQNDDSETLIPLGWLPANCRETIQGYYTHRQ